MATRRENEHDLKMVTEGVIKWKAALVHAQRELSLHETRQKKLVEALAPKRSAIRANVSDHALLRYLEKRFKLDLPTLRAEILTPYRVNAIEAGANKIRFDGLTFIVKDQTIVTVMK